jgi:hypothetical protein
MLSPQQTELLTYLVSSTHHSITVIEAFKKLKICCLHKRIIELIDIGIDIDRSKMIDLVSGKHVKLYQLRAMNGRLK